MDIKNKYIIVDLKTMDYMKDKNGKIIYYDTINDASDVSGIYELDGVWICKLILNHIEL